MNFLEERKLRKKKARKEEGKMGGGDKQGRKE